MNEPIRHPARHGLNIAPLIDVVFILLAFLLVYSSMDATLPVELPVAGGEMRESDPALILTLDAEGRLYRDNTPVTLEELEGQVQPGMQALIRPDEHAPSGELVRLMEWMGRHGLSAEIAVRPPQNAESSAGSGSF